MTREEIIAAAEATLRLALTHHVGHLPSPEPSLYLPHLQKMLDQMKAPSFSLGKLNRWLGWMQAAVVAGSCGKVTLADMKEINRPKDQDLGLAQPPAQAVEGDVRKALKALIKATQEFHEAATSHFNDSDYDFDLFLAKAEAELSVTALPDAIAALSAEGSGTIAAARLPEDQQKAADAWPAGCIKRSSCARNKACMYGSWSGQCRHLRRDIADEVEKAAATPTIADPDGEAQS